MNQLHLGIVRFSETPQLRYDGRFERRARRRLLARVAAWAVAGGIWAWALWIRF